jgi:redox-sensing transcriptional repressor
MARPVDKSAVPAVTVPRLTVYLRKLRELQARGVERVSSKQLAGLIDLNAAQIRKDFSYFGEFGTRGVGYEVDRLVDEIKRCLGLERSWNVVIIGAGSLGTALARYRGFAEQGFKLVAMFDASQRKVGVSFGDGRTIRDVADLESFCHEERVDIAIVAVPAHAAQSGSSRRSACAPSSTSRRSRSSRRAT